MPSPYILLWEYQSFLLCSCVSSLVICQKKKIPTSLSPSLTQVSDLSSKFTLPDTDLYLHTHQQLHHSCTANTALPLHSPLDSSQRTNPAPFCCFGLPFPWNLDRYSSSFTGVMVSFCLRLVGALFYFYFYFLSFPSCLFPVCHNRVYGLFSLLGKKCDLDRLF